MKYLPLLGSLLLSASPGFADDFVYLSCETKTQLRVIDAETAKVIRDFEEIESTDEDNISKEIYRIDLKNSQYTHHLEGNRKSDVQAKIDAKIKNGKLMHYGEGPRGHIETKISFDPPGEILINGSYVGFAMDGMRPLTYIGEYITKGSCKDIDASEFENSLNQ
tara:strand:- start:1479 stop:1970 length:492 start_codon:yes stop_codon:yes gene_type:complete